ncbi:MAG: malonyl CoA-acyl carrier protein transacylase, partial [Planctomycetota bacterium]
RDSGRIQVISNVTAAPVDTVDAVRETLATQVCAPVLWEKSMRFALAEGHSQFLEPGPGTILAGILRKIDQEPVVVPAARPEDLDAILTSMGAS